MELQFLLNQLILQRKESIENINIGQDLPVNAGTSF